MTTRSPKTKHQTKLVDTSSTSAGRAGQDARAGAKAPQKREPRQPTGGKAKISPKELLAGCRKLIEESMNQPCSEVEREARERLEEYEAESQLDREIRDAAEAINEAIRGAIKVARHCRGTSYGNFADLVGSFIRPFMKSRHELKRLSWRLPPGKRESNSQITHFIEAIDRTNFLELVDRPATNKEIACLFYILGGVAIPHSEREPTLLATLRKTIDAVHKCRSVEYHGRPAFIAKVKRDIAKKLRELAANGVVVPRVKRAYTLY
jgi:hypothetical protein